MSWCWRSRESRDLQEAVSYILINWIQNNTVPYRTVGYIHYCHDDSALYPPVDASTARSMFFFWGRKPKKSFPPYRYHRYKYRYCYLYASR
jgi:hypothetical protein